MNELLSLSRSLTRRHIETKHAASANVCGAFVSDVGAFVVFAILRLLWVVGVLLLIVVAVADLLFGNGEFNKRARDFLPRIGVSLLWPLAALTPRGRYLLWARWRN
jgi:hypothetical protein